MRFKRGKAIASVMAVLALAGCQQDTGSSQAQVPKGEAPAQSTSQSAQPTAYNGPFGLKMGLSLEDAKALIPSLSADEEKPGVYSAANVPISHPDFESYSLTFSQKSGLCKIVGIGKDIASGDAGFEVRSAFDALDEALTKKYGKGKKYDFTSERYESPEFWMMYLLKKNRTLAKVWSKEKSSILTNSLSAITLEAGATDMSTGYLVMRYEFENMSDCVAEATAEKNKGL